MQVIDLDTGETVQAANEQDLLRALRDRIAPEEMSDDELRALISERSYFATDS
jgi:hypothetical protein